MPEQSSYLYAMDQPTKGLKITLKQALCEIDAAQMPFLLTFAVDQEVCLKHVSNLFDILTLAHPGPTTQPAPLLKSPVNWFNLRVEDA